MKQSYTQQDANRRHFNGNPCYMGTKLFATLAVAAVPVVFALTDIDISRSANGESESRLVKTAEIENITSRKTSRKEKISYEDVNRQNLKAKNYARNDEPIKIYGRRMR